VSETIEELMRRLRGEYLAEIPGRLKDLRRAVEAVALDQADARRTLAGLFHKLVGSSGAFGYGDVSDRCRETERWLLAEDGPSPKEAAARLTAVIAEIEGAFGREPTTPPIA
jgi:HPt (histidine-containing phosphotransfer) domain-containing protein